ncbi:MAG: hypothetical protein ABSG64_12660 [Solirubrobacteraceae bacterium]|jgi:hypothetical protein
MAKQPSEPQPAGRSADAKFSDLKKEIAERNAQAHKEARSHQAARQKEQLKLAARNRLDLDR